VETLNEQTVTILAKRIIRARAPRLLHASEGLDPGLVDELARRLAMATGKSIAIAEFRYLPSGRIALVDDAQCYPLLAPYPQTSPLLGLLARPLDDDETPIIILES
jgi:hypothetical protein